MAERCLLHKNKLDKLKQWLASKGYDILTPKGTYEVLRACKGKETVIIFEKIGAKEHLTVQQKDYKLIRQFIRESHKHTKENENEHKSNKQSGRVQD